MGELSPFKFSGRIGRMQFLFFGVGISFMIYVFFFALVLFMLPTDPLVVVPLLFGFVAVTVLATSSYGARRLQDFNQPGSLYWLSLVPGVSLPFFLVLLLVPGTPGPNRYGTRAGAERAQTASGESALGPATEPTRYSPPLVSGRASEAFIPEPEGESGAEHFSHSRLPTASGASHRPTAADIGLGIIVDPVSGREVDAGRVHLIRQAPSGYRATVCGMPAEESRVRLVAGSGQPTCVSCLARM